MMSIGLLTEVAAAPGFVQVPQASRPPAAADGGHIDLGGHDEHVPACMNWTYASCWGTS
eukprot:CAMPEP_0171504000 /NCGR_PEP_ID=MMETSP0958-20121227/11276_1 /TAXON_ID=87120 /ORGANISM="Aurantiochytrium limacinum, Strain ATCCMYA-1381" /LENGTH=58 /DNA_ID=CAMNT_0012039689 /DNA_START=88 /DNA_END=264 /DNA_ORIENTATION=-